MKAVERIFLYSVLVVLIFYVFLVDGNVESQVAIQKEIKARRIVIVNDAGQEVVMLWADEAANGIISISNKTSTPVVFMGVSEEYGGVMFIGNKAGNPVAYMGAYEDDGLIEVYNKQGDMIATLP